MCGHIFSRRVIFHEPFLFVDDRGIGNCYPDARYAASLARHLDSGKREEKEKEKWLYVARRGRRGIIATDTILSRGLTRD